MEAYNAGGATNGSGAAPEFADALARARQVRIVVLLSSRFLLDVLPVGC